MLNYILVFTSILFFIVSNYLFCSKKQHTLIEYILLLLVFLQFILSILFWINPTKNSHIHKIDAIFAKIISIIFIIYILFVKKMKFSIKCIYFNILFLILLFAYLSNIKSSNGWCSRNHILCHFIVHILGIITIIFVFL